MLKKIAELFNECIQKPKAFLVLMFLAFTIIFAMMGAGIGGVFEYGKGDLGFQSEFIAANELDPKINVEEHFRQEHPDLDYDTEKEKWQDQLTIMQKWSRAFTGNVALAGAYIGAAVGLTVAFVTGLCTSGYTIQSKYRYKTIESLGVDRDLLTDEQIAGLNVVLSTNGFSEKQKESAEGKFKKVAKIFNDDKSWGARMINKRLAQILFGFTFFATLVGALGYTGVIPGEYVAICGSIGGLGIVVGGSVYVYWKNKAAINKGLANCGELILALMPTDYRRRRMTEADQSLQWTLFFAASVALLFLKKIFQTYKCNKPTSDLRKSLDDIIVLLP